jgi:hypothetical protein
MAHQTLEQRKEYSKQYRERNKERLRAYRLGRLEGNYRKNYNDRIHHDTEMVLKSIPNPFGSFEKAKYIIYKDYSASERLYSFVTTCRNTEDCIELMKQKFKELSTSRYCYIYKIQNGIKKLIFKHEG